MQTVTYIQGGRFGGLDDDDPRYKCCCGIIHVRNGAMIIAIVEIIFSILVALGGITGVTSGKYKSSSESGSYFNCGITIIVCLLMIYGLWKTSRYFLIPHMVFQIIFIIICGLLAVVFIILTIGFNAITSNR
uniref:DUF7027 domain-containing protein n=1 Tax=Romanomermis culicivorax TaxID=13658 RepID=A0A915JLT4_ROMCU